jgi:hypothetical protein
MGLFTVDLRDGRIWYGVIHSSSWIPSAFADYGKYCCRARSCALIAVRKINFEMREMFRTASMLVSQRMLRRLELHTLF